MGCHWSGADLIFPAGRPSLVLKDLQLLERPVGGRAYVATQEPCTKGILTTSASRMRARLVAPASHAEADLNRETKTRSDVALQDTTPEAQLH